MSKGNKDNIPKSGGQAKLQGGKEKNMDNMTMTETARLIIGLRAAGFSEKEINDFILFIETGEEQYKPKEKAE